MKYKQYTSEELAKEASKWATENYDQNNMNEPGGNNSQSWYNYKNEQEEERTEAMEVTNQVIKVGDHVRLRNDSDYLGKVIDEKIVRFLIVQDKDGNQYGTLDEALEVAPRLTPDEAWAELPYTILGQLNKQMATGQVYRRLFEYDNKQIRHECYRLLGAAGIKVDEAVKERVRKAIKRIANEMGVELV